MHFDELHGLSKPLFWEVTFHDTQVELADETPCNGIAMQDWPPLFQRHTLESMTCCVPQVQGFSDAFLSRVFLYDTLLDADTLADEPSQLSEVEFFECNDWFHD